MTINTNKIAAIIFCLLFFSGSVNAQSEDELKYTDAHELMLIGQGFDNPQVDFGRLPVGMEFREDLISLGTNSAGLALRFSTNSKTIAVKWTLRHNSIMDHMAFTGIKGLDMYKLNDKGQWSYIGTARVNGNDTSHFAVVAKNLAGNMDANNLEEYIAYLPLYDGLVSLEIGVDKEAVIEVPKKKKLIKNKDVKPIVFYGTSITQGGCASRPGMAYPAILGRMLNRETINLGFSGNAMLDFSMAKAIAMLDAESVVVDCLWNCTPQIVTDSAYRFLSHIAKAKPQMKIYMLETLKFAEWKTVYKQLVKDGYKNIVYVESADFIGKDGEATVDGCHYTDLGFYRFANALYPYLKKFKSN
ncbi:hydrolase [Bacteroidia bacterium]|nr:hydrolase [Bacteroidia bacterium]